MNSDDLVFQMTMGCTRKEFFRKAGLMRNAEGFGEIKRCPVCKSEIKYYTDGGQYCEKFSLDYEKSGGCYWHRYADGTNYWTPAAELMQVLSKKHGIPMPKGL